jgi:hypothetical protein
MYDFAIFRVEMLALCPELKKEVNESRRLQYVILRILFPNRSL